MTDDLRKLIEAVEAGTLKMATVTRSPVVQWGSLVMASFDGSVDAAIALCESLLPGWKWGRTLGGEMWVSRCVDYGDNFRVGSGWQIASDPNPARALLLAVLRAKLMEMEDE